MSTLIQKGVSLPLINPMRERFGMNKETESKPHAIPCTYTEEELYEIVKERLQSMENGSAILVDGEKVFSQIRERYGFKA